MASTHVRTRRTRPSRRPSRHGFATAVAAWLRGRHIVGSARADGGTKVGMGLLAAAWSAEFPKVAFNTVWPKHMVATFDILV